MTYSQKLNTLVKNTIEHYSNSEELTTYKKYYDRIEYYNKKYKGKIDLFFTENNINQELFFEGMKKLKHLEMLKKLENNTQNILLNFSKYWITEEQLNSRIENTYNKTLTNDMINNITNWLFNNNYKNNMLTLEEQNHLMINYIHFNAGMKKIKSVL